MPSPPFPVIGPVVITVESPVPAFSSRIPLAGPVVVAAVTFAVVPVAVFLTNIPCLPVPDPVTVPEAFTSTDPVEVFSTYIPCPD